MLLTFSSRKEVDAKGLFMMSNPFTYAKYRPVDVNTPRIVITMICSTTVNLSA
ncbi:hypothetical protein VCHA54P499_10151 [Vibrio chagasii]|nr:hypothetical protein VCHA54P499_10151 [Vibrio chagasii]CAH7110822.1 hypothetical protein VCHA53O466_10453 [Vibrio chagasii]CAH7266053.1 hypothetical protein VCHA39P226_30149 [Vibrio chagasii]CAH7349691.1 hypothetical protein VCHA52P453_40235 [Vibrio chagasii]CAH7368047.1 hypothetical protein VCHA52P456_60043 [Vibrio chagasii]